MPTPPPELKKAPRSWKEAFKALSDYAVSTSLAKVIVTQENTDGSVSPVQVDLEETPQGTIVRITLQ